MANDPYAGLGTVVKPARVRDPYADLGTEIDVSFAAPIPRRSLLEAAGEGVTNIPTSAVAYGKGLVEALTSPVQTAGTLLDIAVGGTFNALPEPVANFIRGLDENPEALDRAINTANQFGGALKARYGSYDAIKNTLATDPVGFAADFSSILSGAGGAARMAGAPQIGQIYSRAAELTNPINALAPVGRAGGRILEKAPVAIANIMSPKSAAYMDAAEGRGNELISQLRQPNLEIVPGSRPTAAEAASPLGLTKFSAMGETAKKVLPTEYAARAAEQEAARLRGVQSVGGTAEDLAALQKGRKETGRVLYGNIEKNVVSIDDTFRSLMQRPSMDKAMKRAAEISAEQGVPFQIGRDVRPNTMAGMATPGKPAQYTVQSLHNLKTALDDIIKDPATFGIGANEARVMGRTRDSLIKWIESKEPGYKTARQTFAKQSMRINQSEVGQFLEGKLTSALPEGAERANVFGAAVKEAPATIKRALTGESRFQQLTDVLQPHQVKIIEAVRDDLARKAATKRQGALGKESAPGMGKLMSETGVRAPNLLNRVTAVANDIMRRLEGKIDRKLAIEIATEMLDPQAAAAALEKAMVRNYMTTGVGQGLRKTGEAVGAAARSTPAKIGAQTQNAMTQAQNLNSVYGTNFPTTDENGAPLRSIDTFDGYLVPVYGVPPRKR